MDNCLLSMIYEPMSFTMKTWNGIKNYFQRYFFKFHMPLIFKKSENEHQKHAISNPRRVNCGRLRIIRSFFSDR